jgi:hypothetical protein
VPIATHEYRHFMTAGGGITVLAGGPSAGAAAPQPGTRPRPAAAAGTAAAPAATVTTGAARIRHVGCALGYGGSLSGQNDLTAAQFRAIVSPADLGANYFFLSSIPASLAAAPKGIPAFAGVCRVWVNFELTHYGINGTYGAGGTPAAGCAADAAALAAFIESCQAGGLDLQVVFNHDVYIRFNVYSGGTLAQNQADNNRDCANTFGYYGAVLRAHGLPVVWIANNYTANRRNDPAVSNPLTIGTAQAPGLGWAACAAGAVDIISTQAYADELGQGQQGPLDNLAELASAFGLPFGIQELGVTPAGPIATFDENETQAWLSYVQGWLAAWDAGPTALVNGTRIPVTPVADVLFWGNVDGPGSIVELLPQNWSAATVGKYRALFAAYDGQPYGGGAAVQAPPGPAAAAAAAPAASVSAAARPPAAPAGAGVPFFWANNGEGGTDGVAVTAANSGGASGTAWDWVGTTSGAGTIRYSATHPAHGAMGYTYWTGATPAQACSELPVSTRTVWFRGFFWFDANPAVPVRVINIVQAGTICAGVQIAADGTVALADQSGTAVAASTAAIPLGQQIRLEGWFRGDPQTGQAEVRLFAGDSAVPAETVTTGLIATRGTPTNVRFGVTYPVANVAQFWGDDYAAGSGGWIGPPAAPAAAPAVQAAAAAPGPAVTATGSAGPSWDPAGSWTLTFSDDFPGTSLDGSKWENFWWPNVGTGGDAGYSYPGNPSLTAAVYAGYATVGGGQLQLKMDNTPHTGNSRTYPYTGSLICSHSHFTQAGGAFEARLYLPANGSGQVYGWPCFWVDDDQWHNELDIIEAGGIASGVTGGTAFNLHWDGAPNDGWTSPAIYSGWHTFGVAWDMAGGSATAYWDGVAVSTRPFQLAAGARPVYLILNYWMAAGGGQVEPPAGGAVMLVDWVRAWQFAGTPAARPAAGAAQAAAAAPAASGPSGQVTFDAAGPGPVAAQSATSPLTWAHVNTAGGAILVGVTTYTGTGNRVTSVTYGGDTLDLLGWVPANNGIYGGIAVYGKTAAKTGSNTVSVAFTGGQSTLGASLSAAGAATLGTPVLLGSYGASTSVTVAGTAAGGLVAAFACFGGKGSISNVFTGTGGVAVRSSRQNSWATGADELVCGTVASAAGSTPAGFDSASAGDYWGIIAVEARPPAPATRPQAGAAAAAGAAPGPSAGGVLLTDEAGGLLDDEAGATLSAET